MLLIGLLLVSNSFIIKEVIEDKKQVTLFLMIDIDITHFKEEELDYLKNIGSGIAAQVR